MSTVIKDHIGNSYPNISAMCSAYNVNISTYHWRIQHGWSVAEALMPPTHKSADLGLECKDHTGRVFKSLKDMCAYYNISFRLYKYRLSQDMTVEEALTSPVNTIDNINTDHEGHTFSSCAALCKYWGIKRTTFLARLRKGWSVERSLTYKLQSHQVSTNINKKE